jgi:hypothetical protein
MRQAFAAGLHRYLLHLLTLLAGVSVVQAGTVSVLSQAGVADTRAPEIELLAPEVGAALYGGEVETFSWRISEANLPMQPRPLLMSIDIDGQEAFRDTLATVSGQEQSLDWLVPENSSDDCRWYLALTDAYGNTAESEGGPHVIVMDGSPAVDTLPERLVFAPNHPNPFNPATRFRFALPAAGELRLSVHDLNGREVALLWNGQREAGWWEIDWRPTGLPSGVYFARLRQGDEVLSRKVLLLK